MMVRRSLKHMASLVMIPAVRWYLRKQRHYTRNGITVTVMPGVFHPGLFASTTFVADYLQTQQLSQQTLLELGCGTGFIAIVAAQAGAKVTATDLSLTALANARHNAAQNRVPLRFIHSDLFQRIEAVPFDWIVVNPPYYAQAPKDESELAWYCGTGFEYFVNFFKSLHGYMHSHTQVIMVLSKGCDLDTIFSIGNAAGFTFTVLREKKVLFDGRNFLYSITSIANPAS